MNTGVMTKRILREFDAATPDEIVAGSHWYDNASQLAESMADTYGQPFHVCAAVIAALSPRQQWVTNVKFARLMVESYSNGDVSPPSCGLGNSVRTAWSILSGNGALSGSKVRSFYENIIGDTFAVTVDTWAGYIAMGKRAQSFTPKQYETIAQAYRNAAKLRNISHRDMQAITWVHVRGRSQ